jgi:hypothetical protein
MYTKVKLVNFPISAGIEPERPSQAQMISVTLLEESQVTPPIGKVQQLLSVDEIPAGTV